MKVKIFIDTHYQKDRLFVEAPKEKEVLRILQSLKGAKWSATKRLWHLEPDRATAAFLYKEFSKFASVDVDNLREFFERPRDQPILLPHPHTITALQKFEIWMRTQRYSIQTVENYLSQLKQFFSFYCKKSYEEITPADVTAYNQAVILERGLSVSYQRGLIGAIKLFYKQQEGLLFDPERLEMPFKERRLPEVLSKEETARVIRVANNLKHKALLSITYGCGLRIGEVLNLKLTDLDKERKLVRIERGKGAKDRYVQFSDKLRNLLLLYYKEFKPRIYLFEGRPGEKYSDRSAQQVLKYCIRKCRIRKRVTLHTLRHSYATHLLEGGTDLRYIQELLGHGSPKTTMIYTHVSSKKISEISSPFDDLAV